jgi:allophanate hydrolase
VARRTLYRVGERRFAVETLGWSTRDGSLDLRRLQAHYRSGALTPVQLIEALYARIDHGEHPNVWIHLLPKREALARAEALGPYRAEHSNSLWGIPFAVKDNIDVLGMPTTAACPQFAYAPVRSAQAVEQLLACGAICLGKTNMDQFATGLVGTRSPHGACRNVFNAAYLAGGSSSGSAVAVAGGLVSFALGTDTAGSGRVPAALNNIVGLKPTRGLVSTEGVVPACRSLDCVSVFALCTRDAARVREAMQGQASTRGEPFAASSLRGLRFGIPHRSQLEFFGDEGASELFASAAAALCELGASLVEFDFTPFARIGDLLYGGPWVAERAVAVGDFIRAQPNAILPLIRDIVLGADRYSAADAFRGQYALEALRPQAQATFDQVDVLLLPTTPTNYRLEDDLRDGRAFNDRLGIYTRFLNLLGNPGLAISAGFKPDGLPFGVTLVMPCGRDRELDALGATLEHKLSVGMGKRRTPLFAEPSPTEPAPPAPGYARLAVVGAHLRGQALNHQLITARARFVQQTRTAPVYRLYALAGTKPLKPGLLRVAADGVHIEIELWDVPIETYGTFVAGVPAPLCIGTLTCEDAERVQGFLCESLAVQDAEDISHFGGFRGYLASLPR